MYNRMIDNRSVGRRGHSRVSNEDEFVPRQVLIVHSQWSHSECVCIALFYALKYLTISASYNPNTYIYIYFNKCNNRLEYASKYHLYFAKNKFDFDPLSITSILVKYNFIYCPQKINKKKKILLSV